LPRFWKSEKSGATAVICMSGQLCSTVWLITDPSLFA
jgi:hypothetical protein